MSNNQKSSQQDNPVSFGQAHRDPREGLQTDERNGRRDSQQRPSDSENTTGEDEEE